MWTEGTVHLKISKDPTQNPALRQSESTECATDHPIVFLILYIIIGDRGSAVVKVLRYKSEGRWFDSR